jgi:hypothetical protein
MSRDDVPDPTGASRPEERCLQCERVLLPTEDVERTGDGGVFCRSCFESLRGQVETVVRVQGSDINYGTAAVGGVLGGALGSLVWWGFTVLTKISFGLVAIVIGFAVGKGIQMATGRKRSRGLQLLAAGISVVAYVYATYCVNRTFILRELEDPTVTIPLAPDPSLMFQVVRAGFNFFDVIFLAIVVWQAWKMLAPFRLPRAS